MKDKVLSYDVISQKYPSVMVFIYHTKTRTTTLIREFSPAANDFGIGVVAGMIEKEIKKNKEIQEKQEKQEKQDEEEEILTSTSTST